MSFTWLMNQIGAFNITAPRVADSFERFGDLPTELRLQIWHHYFNVPRVHVIKATADLIPVPGYPVTEPSPVTRPIPVRYTELGKGNKRQVRSARQFAAAMVSREALEVFRQVFDPAPLQALNDFEEYFKFMAIWGLHDPHRISPLHHEIESTIATTPEYQEYKKSPTSWRQNMGIPTKAHVNWQRDTIYIDDPKTSDTLIKLCDVKWVENVQRLALLISDRELQRSWDPHDIAMSFQTEIGTVMGHFEQIILVVRLPDPNSLRKQDIERDDLGFVSYNSAMQSRGGAWDVMQATLELREITKLLECVFPHLARGDGIRWALDVDCHGAKDKSAWGRRMLT